MRRSARCWPACSRRPWRSRPGPEPGAGLLLIPAGPSGSAQLFLDDLVAQGHALGADPRLTRCCHGWDLLAALPAETAPHRRRVVTDPVHVPGYGPGFGGGVEYHLRDVRAPIADVHA